MFKGYPWATGDNKDTPITEEFQRTEARDDMKRLSDQIRNLRSRKRPAEHIAHAEALRAALKTRLTTAAPTLGRYTKRGKKVSDAVVVMAAASRDQEDARTKMRRAIGVMQKAADIYHEACTKALGAGTSAAGAAREAMAGQADEPLSGDAALGLDVEEEVEVETEVVAPPGDGRPRCGVMTRSGQPCKRLVKVVGGRCPAHAGAPATPLCAVSFRQAEALDHQERELLADEATAALGQIRVGKQADREVSEEEEEEEAEALRTQELLTLSSEEEARRLVAKVEEGNARAAGADVAAGAEVAARWQRLALAALEVVRDWFQDCLEVDVLGRSLCRRHAFCIRLVAAGRGGSAMVNAIHRVASGRAPEEEVGAQAVEVVEDGVAVPEPLAPSAPPGLEEATGYVGFEVSCVYAGGSNPGEHRSVMVTDAFLSKAGRAYWRVLHGDVPKTYAFDRVSAAQVLGPVPQRSRIDLGPLAWVGVDVAADAAGAQEDEEEADAEEDEEEADAEEEDEEEANAEEEDDAEEDEEEEEADAEEDEEEANAEVKGAVQAEEAVDGQVVEPPAKRPRVQEVEANMCMQGVVITLGGEPSHVLLRATTRKTVALRTDAILSCDEVDGYKKQGAYDLNDGSDDPMWACVWQDIQRHRHYGRPSTGMAKVWADLQAQLEKLDGKLPSANKVKVAGKTCHGDKMYSVEIAPGAEVHQLKN